MNAPETEILIEKTIEELLAQIFQDAKGGNYIFRGESDEEYPNVSSKLYRELGKYMKQEDLNVQVVQEVQKEEIEIAKKHTKEENPDIILEQIQHFGGSTNQIDFTTDYLVALFFACEGKLNSNGRLIFLDKGKFKKTIHEPRNPQNRVIAQKSVFVRPPSGLVEVNQEDIITINKELKVSVLRYLAQYHDINAHTIYNDIHGYITRSKPHRYARENFYHGFSFHEAGDYDSAEQYYKKALEYDPIFEYAYNNLGNVYGSMKRYGLAFANYNKAIELNRNYAEAYLNRGITKIKLQNSKGARKDLKTAFKLAKKQKNESLAARIQKEIDDLDAQTNTPHSPPAAP